MVGDSIFSREGVRRSLLQNSHDKTVLLEKCQKGSIPLDLKQARPQLSTEVITDTGWMLLRCLRNINESLLQCRWGDTDEELCEHNIFEYVQGLDLKAFSCLRRRLDEAL